MSRKIPTWDLFVDGQETPVLQGVHKNNASAVIADLESNGINYTWTQSKSVRSSKYSKKRKDRE